MQALKLWFETPTVGLIISAALVVTVIVVLAKKEEPENAKTGDRVALPVRRARVRRRRTRH